MSAWIAQHRKLLVSVAGAVITVAIQAGWTPSPYVSAVILVATAAGVYRAPNDPQPAPAAPALPDAQGGGGHHLSESGAVRVVSPAAGTEGGPVTGGRP
jgi:hypothetical protein